ncbi:MAG: potassium transporter TrkG [Eubacteriales bacterium]
MYESIQEEQRKKLRLSTMQMLVLGFLSLILIGAFLLWLPISNVSGYIPFIDALFSSTSAVCVTGLMTVVPATQFTLFGKVVLLVLIQIGGLGVIACAMAFFIIIGKKITVKERVIIQESYNLDTLSGLVSMILNIVKMTAIVESIGAILFAIQFVPEYGMEGIGYAVFHSVSAFCNAGIDLIGADSFAPYLLNPLVNFTTIGLIVVGGLGFPVWIDIWKTGKLYFKKKFALRKFFHKLQLHSQIAVMMTLVLIIGGTVLYILLEWTNPDTLGALEPIQKVMVAFFQSVTTRTAGFSTLNQAALREQTAFLTCVFMFIGGSPAGTAGGVKTTTIFMLLLTCRAVIRGGKDTECFGKRITEENIKSGISIIVVSFIALLVGIMVMSTFEDFAFLDIIYEVSSALGTVGLTRGITSQLDIVGKMVNIILMYIGRLGPITMALAFGYRRNSLMNMRELPTKRIIVG